MIEDLDSAGMLLFLLRYQNKIKTVGVREKLMEDLNSADPFWLIQTMLPKKCHLKNYTFISKE